MKRHNSAKLITMPKPAPPVFAVESRIVFLRGKKVILDTNLAQLYCVPVKRLNQQVRRNLERFPEDFVFRLTGPEQQSLRLQFATSKKKRGGRRYLPFAFTEHGAIMAATVLNSRQAIRMSVFVVRAFVRLREMLATNQQLAEKIDELEGRVETHDVAIRETFQAIRALMPSKSTRRRKIGFQLPAAGR
jgi:ORF6N domain